MKTDHPMEPVFKLSEEQKDRFCQWLKLAIYKQMYENHFLNRMQLQALFCLYQEEEVLFDS